MLRQLVRHRKYIFENAINGFRYRYAGTALGVFWNIFNPIFTTLIYVVVFQQILGYRNAGNADSYVLFLIPGLFPWLTFSSLINAGGKAFLKNADKLRVVNIPPVVFVAIEYLVSYFELNIYFVLMLIIYALPAKLQSHIIGFCANLRSYLPASRFLHYSYGCQSTSTF